MRLFLPEFPLFSLRILTIVPYTVCVNKKILVVDDDRALLESVALLLELAGFTVQTAFRGEDIDARITSFAPDLVLMDVFLAESDGRIICRRLKSKSDTHGMPIVMTSGNPQAKKGSFASGADDFLAKPFDADSLLKVVSRYTKLN